LFAPHPKTEPSFNRNKEKSLPAFISTI